MGKERQALEAIFEKSRNESSKTAKMYFEKDAEIEFLQKEISQLMREKSDKEQIIKSNFIHSSLSFIYSFNLREFENCKYLPRTRE